MAKISKEKEHKMNLELRLPKISIIIPVYNVEKYLETCINSILHQTYKNLEIIFVNDGSKDNSLKILKKYKKIDKRIVVIDQQNGGLSNARNSGLKVFTGEYVTFIDSDDYITNEHIETLYNNIIESDADLSITQFKKIYENKPVKNINESNKVKVITQEKMLDLIFSNDDLSFGVWNKLYKASIIKNQFFDEQILFQEDLPFIYNYVTKCSSVCYSTKQTYMYLQRNGSILRSFNAKKYFTKYKFYNFLLSHYKNDTATLNKVKALLCLHNLEAMYYFYKYKYYNLNHIFKIHNFTKQNIKYVFKYKSLKKYKRHFARFAYFILSSIVIKRAKKHNKD